MAGFLWATIALAILFAVPYASYLLLLAVHRPTGVAAVKRPGEEPTISVVLPTYNEASIIEGTLERMVSLEYPLEKLEIVMIDASDNETAEIARSFFANRRIPRFTVIEQEERRGVAAAVNRAVPEASGEIIFRTDCDARVAPGALRHAAATLADSTVGGVTGRQTEVIGESQVEADYRGLLARNQLLESHLDSTFIVHGPCFAFRSRLFDPVEPDSLADDTEIGIRIRAQGYRVVMDPAMAFAETGVSAFAGRRTRKDRRAMGLVQVLVRFRHLVGRHGWYGRFILPMYWLFLVIGPWVLLATVVAATGTAVSAAGGWGLVVPILVGVLVGLGQRDALGPPATGVCGRRYPGVVPARNYQTHPRSRRWNLGGGPRIPAGVRIGDKSPFGDDRDPSGKGREPAKCRIQEPCHPGGLIWRKGDGAQSGIAVVGQ